MDMLPKLMTRVQMAFSFRERKEPWKRKILNPKR